MKKIYFLFLFILTIEVNAQLSDFKNIDFSKSDSIALRYKNESLSNLPVLTHLLTADLSTDIEKFRAIYTWVSTNIANDHGMFSKNKRKRNKYKNDKLKLEKWNNSLLKKMFHTLLKEKKTVCTGYAYLIKELSKLANINCEIINGYGRLSNTNIENLTRPNHSWNAVELNGKWYLCDATWSSGFTNLSNNEFIFKYNDGYFLASPKLFIKNHYPLDKKWMLLKGEKPLFKEFLESPLVYSSAFKYLAENDFPKTMKNTIATDEKVQFKYKLLNPLERNNIRFLINTTFSKNSIKPIKIIKEKDMLTVEYQFIKKGFYDLHILFSDNVIATYTFTVKK